MPNAGEDWQLLGGFAKPGLVLLQRMDILGVRAKFFAFRYVPCCVLGGDANSYDRENSMAGGRGYHEEAEMPRRRQLLGADDLGEMIRTRRERLGIAQLELASMVGIDAGNLSKIERGNRRSHLDTYIRLCGALGIDLFAEARS